MLAPPSGPMSEAKIDASVGATALSIFLAFFPCAIAAVVISNKVLSTNKVGLLREHAHGAATRAFGVACSLKVPRAKGVEVEMRGSL